MANVAGSDQGADDEAVGGAGGAGGVGLGPGCGCDVLTSPQTIPFFGVVPLLQLRRRWQLCCLQAKTQFRHFAGPSAVHNAQHACQFAALVIRYEVVAQSVLLRTRVVHATTDDAAAPRPLVRSSVVVAATYIFGVSLSLAGWCWVLSTMTSSSSSRDGEQRRRKHIPIQRLLGAVAPPPSCPRGAFTISRGWSRQPIIVAIRPRSAGDPDQGGTSRRSDAIPRTPSNCDTRRRRELRGVELRRPAI
jgi:hypothetical protein